MKKRGDGGDLSDGPMCSALRKVIRRRCESPSKSLWPSPPLRTLTCPQSLFERVGVPELTLSPLPCPCPPLHKIPVVRLMV